MPALIPSQPAPACSKENLRLDPTSVRQLTVLFHGNLPPGLPDLFYSPVKCTAKSLLAEKVPPLVALQLAKVMVSSKKSALDVVFS